MSTIDTPQMNSKPFSATTPPNDNMGLGTSFKILNQDTQTESYCIGTVHAANEAMVNLSCFHRILPHCATLYTETGELLFINSAHLNVPERPHPFQHIPYRFALEDAISLEAWHKKIPLVALDLHQGIPEMDREYEEVLQQISTTDPYTQEKNMMEEALKDGQVPDFVEMHSHVMQGRINKLEEFRTHEQSEDPESRVTFEKREARWAEILIPVLRLSNQPICIAVGASHIVGDGLLDRFRKAGFQVEQILATNPSDRARFIPPAVLEPRNYFPIPGWLPLLIDQAEQTPAAPPPALPQPPLRHTPPAAAAHRPAKKARSAEPTQRQLRPRQKKASPPRSNHLGGTTPPRPLGSTKRPAFHMTLRPRQKRALSEK